MDSLKALELETLSKNPHFFERIENLFWWSKGWTDLSNWFLVSAFITAWYFRVTEICIGTKLEMNLLKRRLSCFEWHKTRMLNIMKHHVGKQENESSSTNFSILQNTLEAWQIFLTECFIACSRALQTFLEQNFFETTYWWKGLQSNLKLCSEDISCVRVLTKTLYNPLQEKSVFV